jgi:hypothetical protein
MMTVTVKVVKDVPFIISFFVSISESSLTVLYTRKYIRSLITLRPKNDYQKLLRMTIGHVKNLSRLNGIFSN